MLRTAIATKTGLAARTAHKATAHTRALFSNHYSRPTQHYHHQTTRTFTTTPTPPPAAPAEAAAATATTATTEPAIAIAIDDAPLPPQWKNPISVLLDFTCAATLTYLGVQGYRFLTDSPAIVDIFYHQAIQSPFLIEHLGTPIKRDLLWWGSVDEYYARVDFGVSGPKGSGQVQGKAFRSYNEKTGLGDWQMIFLYGALPQFDNRLTDLLPLDENEINLLPYLPSPDDPSAAHALAGAPTLPFTPKNILPVEEDASQPPPPQQQELQQQELQQQQQQQQPPTVLPIAEVVNKNDAI